MDWSKVDGDLLKLIVQRAETYLNAQLTLATSADQRAATMASIFAAVGAVALGAIVTVWAEAPLGSGPVIAAGLVVAALFLVAAGLCVWATLPSNFHLAGNEPDSYDAEIRAGTKEHAALIDEAQHYQKAIEKNHGVLSANAKKFWFGAVIGVLAPLVGVFAWLLASHCLLAPGATF